MVNFLELEILERFLIRFVGRPAYRHRIEGVSSFTKKPLKRVNMTLLPIVIFTICLAITSTAMETNIYTKTIQLQRGGKYICILIENKCVFICHFKIPIFLLHEPVL